MMNVQQRSGNLEIDWLPKEGLTPEYATHVFYLIDEFHATLTFGRTHPELQIKPMDTPRVRGEYFSQLQLPFRTVKELSIVLQEMVKQIEMKHGEIKLPKNPEDVFNAP